MAAEISTTPRDPVKQFSVFTENRVGRLHEVTALLKHHNVHVMGITVLDTTDSAIVATAATKSSHTFDVSSIPNQMMSSEK